MTDKRLILRKSLWFGFLAYSQSRATTFIVSPKSSGTVGTVADDLCGVATVSCTARVAANAGPRRTHQPRGRALPYDVVGNAGGTRRSSADRIWPASISCAGAHEAKTGRVKNSPGTYRLQKPPYTQGPVPMGQYTILDLTNTLQYVPEGAYATLTEPANCRGTTRC
jgi:hypothetical protein